MRDLAALVDTRDSAWPELQAAMASSAVPITVLPPDDDSGACLHRLQVTTRSVLGALAFHPGAVLVDHGWLRLLGAGHGPLPSIADANGLPATPAGPPPLLVVAADVLGGRFAVNGGALPGDPGEVNFWSVDTLDWQPLGAGHGDFVHWVLTEGPAQLYESLRWPGWEDEVRAVPYSHGLQLYPPPCTVEGQDVAAVSRQPVPMHELDGWLATLAATPDGPARGR